MVFDGFSLFWHGFSRWIWQVRRQLLEALRPEAQALLQQQVLLRKRLLFSLRHAKSAGGVAVAMASLAKRDWTEKKIERFRHALAMPEALGVRVKGTAARTRGWTWCTG